MTGRDTEEVGGGGGPVDERRASDIRVARVATIVTIKRQIEVARRENDVDSKSGEN
jgi:hypothetical protein